MRSATLSILTAAILITDASAFENIKTGGDAKFFYATNDCGANADFLDQCSSAADIALRLGIRADIRPELSIGVNGYALTTLGLENNLVSDSWSGAHEGDGDDIDDAAWIGEMWMAGSAGNTSAKIGRMELDTPLLYSERWSIVPNTFDAAVALNRGLSGTTLAAGWIGKGNGVNPGGVAGIAEETKNSVGIDRFMARGARFGTFGSDGAHLAGVINRSFETLTLQGWYYNLPGIADAWWAEGELARIAGSDASVGVQLVYMDPKGEMGRYDKTQGYALRIGYEGIEDMLMAVGYSKTAEKGVFKVANLATDNLVDADSKLYTETVWNRGYVGAPNAESVKLTLRYTLREAALIEATYVGVNNAHSVFTTNDEDIEEFALSASTSFGPLHTRLAYISSDLAGNANGGRYDTLIGTLTLPF